jgi:energy-coupling factor transporter ATP-binding protein EcfA2
LAFFLEDNSFRPLSEKSREKLRLFQNTEFEGDWNGEAIKLVSLSDLTNINALAPNQKLEFNDELTVVYGANGSGKSGYARVIGCAGFTRGDRDVIPNAFKKDKPNEPQRASIKIKIGEAIQTINYKIGGDCPELNSIRVFDSSSVNTHLTGSYKISFVPAGLSLLTELARVHDECCRRLEARTAPLLAPHQFGALFDGHSEIKKLVSEPNLAANLKQLQRLAQVSPAEERQADALEFEIAQLKADKISEQIRETAQTVRDLETLRRQLGEIENQLSEDQADKICRLSAGLAEQQRKAAQTSATQFETPEFQAIGSPTWRNFIESAKKLTILESGNDARQTEKCLLCRQPLDAAAKELLQSLWAFLADESQARLNRLKSELEFETEKIKRVNFDCFNEQNVSRRYLQHNSPDLLDKILRFIETARRRREQLREIAASETITNVSTLAASVDSEIEKIVAGLKLRLSELEQSDPQKKIFERSEELRLLKHRLILRENIKAIERSVEKAKSAAAARKAIGSTKRITLKYNELFKELVTDKYVELFEATLKKLNCPLKVQNKTKAQKGETFKQMILVADDWQTSAYKLDKVLSEGEKRAVALADFLTEIALDETTCGIVLDDPVTSLDCEWKETVAECLVAESKKRQVIVFTHDLTFLSLMQATAEKQNVKIDSHWIIKEGDGEPGHIYLNNSPLTEGERRKSNQASQFYQKAVNSDNPLETEMYLKLGFGSLRSSYEALIVYDIFNKVVMRHEERVSVDRLKEVVMDKEIFDEVREKYDLLSRYNIGHFQSDSFNQKKATPEMLKKEIDAFNDLKGRIRKIKNRKENSILN